MAKLFNAVPKWRNFAKSGRTGDEIKVFSISFLPDGQLLDLLLLALVRRPDDVLPAAPLVLLHNLALAHLRPEAVEGRQQLHEDLDLAVEKLSEI